MSAFPLHAARLGAMVLAAASLAACGSFDGLSGRIAGSFTPYKVEVVQGNFVSKEQVEALKPGMSRQQVRDVLGTPLITSLFHSDRWDYVFTIRRQGVAAQQRKLVVFFNGNVLARFEGDDMPSEADFVASLDSRRKNAKVPVLEASEEALTKASPAPAAPMVAAPNPATSGPLPSYPPLEPATGR